MKAQKIMNVGYKMFMRIYNNNKFIKQEYFENKILGDGLMVALYLNEKYFILNSTKNNKHIIVGLFKEEE